MTVPYTAAAICILAFIVIGFINPCDLSGPIYIHGIKRPIESTVPQGGPRTCETSLTVWRASFFLLAALLACLMTIPCVDVAERPVSADYRRFPVSAAYDRQSDDMMDAEDDDIGLATIGAELEDMRPHAQFVAPY